ncbi:hypothetical protein PUN4_60036 [Paraburkholderia unamae]|nr:hypothetical protein PUN4_60036 [Paraburkholderia unamae]
MSFTGRPVGRPVNVQTPLRLFTPLPCDANARANLCFFRALLPRNLVDFATKGNPDASVPLQTGTVHGLCDDRHRGRCTPSARPKANNNTNQP